MPDEVKHLNELQRLEVSLILGLCAITFEIED